MQAQQTESFQQDIVRQRMAILIVVAVVISGGLLFRVISFQFPQDPRVVQEFAAQRDANYGRIERFEAPRGNIYDRNGHPLAVNTRRYRVGISPNLIANPGPVAAQLAAILNRDELELYNLLTNASSYEYLETVDPEVWRQIDELNLSFAIRPERVQRRFYPQGTLASQIVGFVAGADEEFRGYNGVEGYYNQQLAGLVRDQEVSNIPFDLPQDPSALGQGADLVLTIDRDVQFLAETQLQEAIARTGSSGGTIIIMRPRTGDVLAMASYPSYDPNNYFNITNPRDLRNPAISDVYEPGSVFKVVTVAAALEAGTVTPSWTYNDQGRFDIGGIQIYNWDRGAYGLVDATQVLVDSLNVGVATMAYQMGWEEFYRRISQFNIGRTTRIDLQGEEAGILRTPNSLRGDWSESDLGTNSFGQGLSVTPLQMLTAVNAIANDGLMMQPRVVYQIVDGDNVYSSGTSALGRPISAETARIVTDMMVSAVRDGLDDRAQVPGYTIAGKTGTAQYRSAAGNYDPNRFIMTFVGFLPADDPQVSVLVKLDHPTSGRWASEVAAPVFSRLTGRLVDLLEIPTDDVRLALAAEGIATGELER
jgi:cell division protein FtsI (penicillin-binding protein 3)